MSARVILAGVVAVLVLPAAAYAQFIGDALASAGVALTEQQAVEVMGSVRGASAPAAGSTLQSSGPQGAKVYGDATEVGKDVGIRREGSASSEGSSSSGPTVVTGSSASDRRSGAAISQPQVGGSSGFAGAKLQAATIDADELAAWQAAMRPVGAKVSSIPPSAIEVSGGAATLHYDKGVFYEKKGSGWMAVAAPAGVAIPSKPLGAATVFAGGKPYIYYYGTFYLYDGARRAYVVVAPPSGALIDYLPDTAKKVEWQGATHYQYAGTYYKPYYRGSKLVFEVAS